MGLFSGIAKAVGSVFKPVGEVIGAISDPISSVMNIASPFMQQSSAASANAANIEQAEAQRAWQAQQNQIGMDFSAGQAGTNRDFQRRMFDDAMNFNYHSAEDNRRYSTHMSNTAYQRAVTDMRAAGLNPLLAVSQGGASTPSVGASSAPGPASGSSPSGMTSSGAAASVRPTFSAQSVATAAQAAQLGAQVRNTQADTANKEATADQIRAQTRLMRLQGDTEGYRPSEVSNRAALIRAQERTEEELRRDRRDKLSADADLSRSSARQIESQRVLMKELMSNPWTKDWAPYLLDGFKGR